jgi:hypothetical protein
LWQLAQAPLGALGILAVRVPKASVMLAGQVTAAPV